MTLSIIIVNWRSKDYLRMCLISIRATCAELAPQIIVVDGGSFDGCGEMLAADFPEVVFIQSEKNVGFARANNLGVKRATGDILWFLNPDTEVQSGAGTLLLRALEDSPDTGAIGPRLLNTDGSLQTSCVQSLPTPLNQALDCELLRRLSPHSGLWGISALWSATTPVEVEALSGASLMIRAEVFRRVGDFSSCYFMYGEDLDLCLKVRKAGFTVWFHPSAEVVHHGGGSSKGEFRRFSNVMMRESVYRFLKVNRSRWSAAGYRGGLFAVALIRLVLLLPAGVVLPDTLAPCRKWLSILRWSIGLEPWVRAYPS